MRRVNVLKDLFFDRISCINVIKMKKIRIFREIAATGYLFWIGGCGFGAVKRSIPNRFDGKDVLNSDWVKTGKMPKR